MFKDSTHDLVRAFPDRDSLGLVLELLYWMRQDRVHPTSNQLQDFLEKLEYSGLYALTTQPFHDFGKIFKIKLTRLSGSEP